MSSGKTFCSSLATLTIIKDGFMLYKTAFTIIKLFICSALPECFALQKV